MSHNPVAGIQPVEVFTMRADIAPGATFPDCELSDHTGKHRKLCELQGQHPISRDRYRSDSVLDGGAHFGRW